jgi:exportin-1
MAQAAQNMDVLSSNDNIKILSNVLKTNVSACTSIGSFYLPQIGRIFLDMLGLYKAVSGIISETVDKEGTIFRDRLSGRSCRDFARFNRYKNPQD